VNEEVNTVFHCIFAMRESTMTHESSLHECVPSQNLIVEDKPSEAYNLERNIRGPKFCSELGKMGGYENKK